jgi:hypothetical protein
MNIFKPYRGVLCFPLTPALSPFGGAREGKCQRDEVSDYEKYFDTDYTD